MGTPHALLKMSVRTYLWYPQCDTNAIVQPPPESPSLHLHSWNLILIDTSISRPPTTLFLCWRKALRTSQGKTRYPHAREKRRYGAFRCHYLPPSQSGKDPGRGRKSVESVEGGMDCQSFQTHRHAPSGRNRVQPATCPLVNTNSWRRAKSLEYLEGSLGWKSFKVCSHGPRSRKKRATVTRPDLHTWWMASGRSSCPVLSGNNNCRSWNVHFQLS